MAETIFTKNPEDVIINIEPSDIEVNIEPDGRGVERHKDTKVYVGEAGLKDAFLFIKDLQTRVEELENPKVIE